MVKTTRLGVLRSPKIDLLLLRGEVVG